MHFESICSTEGLGIDIWSLNLASAIVFTFSCAYSGQLLDGIPSVRRFLALAAPFQPLGDPILSPSVVNLLTKFRSAFRPVVIAKLNETTRTDFV